jgi:hypothetical protein
MAVISTIIKVAQDGTIKIPEETGGIYTAVVAVEA